MEVGDYSKKRVLSVFSLVMINVIAVDSLRTLPISAEYGFSLVFYYLLAAFLFFIPTALVAAELATTWPATGGLYVWVREAYGQRLGFVTIWLQWIYNVVWYPTILAFMAASLAYLFNPALAKSPTYLLSMVLILFWGGTIANCFGMRVSSWVSTVGAIGGTLIPMLLIIVLGGIWLKTDFPNQIHFTWKEFYPDLKNIHNLAFLLAVLFGLVGMEMSAVHAEEVKDPQRDYPRALFYSTIIIFATLVLSSLAIALVIPKDKLELVSGLNEAFAVFFNAYHMPWMIPIISILIVLGGVSGVSAWIIGPTKGLLMASHDGSLPALFSQVNKHGAPVPILLLQGVIVTLLSTLFVLMPTVNSSYWLLTALTAQLALLVYIIMFMAAWRLRVKRPFIERPYKIPGGNFGMFLVCAVGILTCLSAMLLGFFPPTNIQYASQLRYESLLWGGVLLFALPPYLIFSFCRRGNMRTR